MIVVGIGFRADAGLEVLEAAFRAIVAGRDWPDALASLAERASLPVMIAFAQRLSLPVVAVGEAEIRGQMTPTVSSRINARFGTGSLAEAVALVAVGPGAVILVPRMVTACGRATAAMAKGMR